MIENGNTSEIMGQTELTDFMPEAAGTGNGERGTADGYDAAGNLMNAVAQTPAEPAAMSADADARLSALATEINAITEQTRGVVISAALAVGKRLIEAKSLCPAGRFGEWLEKSVSYSERKAQDMMRLYVEYGREGSVPDAIAALDYSKAVALLSAPAEAREALAQRAAGEDLSVRQLQGEIAKLKAERDADQVRIDALLEQTTDLSAAEGRARLAEARAEAAEESSAAAREALLESEKAERLAEAKASASEAAAEELRKLRAEAEARADANEQRARDAVDRANKAAVELSQARAKIAELTARAAEAPEPEVKTVEVLPEDVARELDDLRAQLAEARANQGTGETGNGEKETGASATEKFKWFYANQMKPAFTTALSLLKEVARENPKAADLFATALQKGCEQLMNQLGEGVNV